ncbi:type II toxin-antitoxin system VapC family toxin [Thiorhodovibrio frisius]|uniref:Ribonuclease VapC n=1 Tax=Thiorhodovibrio frisius TaxID=631362 RepID=H8Z2R6_9GAMM|nr:type II toxin-antitoxin system VapC family toxin [Thiorhodovibrio frisius]EIC21652.1 putative nucleic acid-binding protein [Thiorhodovibrio frisius]WPL21620.1 tRNA(fMet)-specific endonuclease VapC [Thiorhodovibrio frisius]
MKILDTDVCIEILRGNRQVLHWRRHTQARVVTTWITACELEYGTAKSTAPDQARALVADFLSTLDILGLDHAAARQFGQHKAALARSGEMLPDADLFIASIALARGAELVTGNLRHFRRFPGLTVEDWIRQSPPEMN